MDNENEVTDKWAIQQKMFHVFSDRNSTESDAEMESLIDPLSLKELFVMDSSLLE